MNNQQRRTGAWFTPQALQVVCQAFDEAWIDIAGDFGDDLNEIEAARLRLAHAVLSVSQGDNPDLETVKRRALQLMARKYHKHGADDRRQRVAERFAARVGGQWPGQHRGAAGQ